ncbi:MAG TPA: hypothetical protein VK141_08975, partial [Nitrosomonas sp.]|nr:hypothetical protein [Nitrosomonas sp.]
MRTVKIERTKLLKEVIKNRANHKKEYDEAMQGYRELVIEALSEKLEDAKKHEDITHYIDLDRPENHLREYDRVIRMLEMSVDKVIELQANEFAQYVTDEWSWKESFVTT